MGFNSGFKGLNKQSSPKRHIPSWHSPG